MINNFFNGRGFIRVLSLDWHIINIEYKIVQLIKNISKKKFTKSQTQFIQYG